MEDFVPVWVAAASSFEVDPAWLVAVASSSFVVAAAASAFAGKAVVLPFGLAFEVVAAVVAVALAVASSYFGAAVVVVVAAAAVHPFVPACAVGPSSVAVAETVPFEGVAAVSPYSASDPVAVGQKHWELGFRSLRELEVWHRG